MSDDSALTAPSVSPTLEWACDESFLATLSKHPVAVANAPHNGVREIHPDERETQDTLHLWSGGQVVLPQTYATPNKYIPFITYQGTATIRAHSVLDNQGGPFMSNILFETFHEAWQTWEATPQGERPAKFPEGAPTRVAFASSYQSSWTLHTDLDDIHRWIRYDGRSGRGGCSEASSTVRNMPTIEDAWTYARHAAEQVIALGVTNVDAMGVAGALTRAKPFP